MRRVCSLLNTLRVNPLKSSQIQTLVNQGVKTFAFCFDCPTSTILINVLENNKTGYGFVRFWDENDANRAINEMQGVVCGTRPMRISVATPKNRPAGNMMQQQHAPMVPQQTAYYGAQP